MVEEQKKKVTRMNVACPILEQFNFGHVGTIYFILNFTFLHNNWHDSGDVIVTERACKYHASYVPGARTGSMSRVSPEEEEDDFCLGDIAPSGPPSGPPLSFPSSASSMLVLVWRVD